MRETARRRKLKIALCSKCQKEKPWTDFCASPSRRPFGLASQCRDCDGLRKANQKRTHYWKDPEKGRAYSRRRQLKLNFGITPEDYEVMFKKQKGRCLICGEKETYIHHATRKQARLAVDHDHVTKKVRGLLCALCNKGLGSFKDDPVRLEKAINYLKEHTCNTLPTPLA